MAVFQKGQKPGPGRPKGLPNQATLDARKAIGDFVDGNAWRLAGWLDRIAMTNPGKAFELFQSVVEYHVPKLNRTEVTGPNGGPTQAQVVVKFEGE